MADDFINEILGSINKAEEGVSADQLVPSGAPSSDAAKKGAKSSKFSTGTANRMVKPQHWYELPEEEDPEIKGKVKYREGRYKLGADQFIANPYVYIPGKLMCTPQFNIADVFKTMGLSVPSLMFRFSSANPTNTWNVRLPASRKYLKEAYEAIAEAEDLQGIDHTRDDNTPLIADGEDRLKNLRGSVAHYHSVLEENCKRLLRNIYSACVQAQAVFRVHEVWSDEYPVDAVAQWFQGSNPSGPPPVIMGVADKTDFHRDVWVQLRDGCVSDYDEQTKTDSEPPDVIIDPRPFYSHEIPVVYKEGRPSRSIPHPAITHLIISDNRQLLEQKIAEAVNWGLILINGGLLSGQLAAQAVQLGLPLICFKYTGGAADICVEMQERVERFIRAKKMHELVDKDLPPRPFPDDMAPGYLPQNWLMPFEDTDIHICNTFNALVENWPDRQNRDTLFTIDMFVTSEDEVQDHLTQTIGNIFSGEYELGGDAAEQMRMSYAWRIRQKFSYNASYYKTIADNLMLTLQFFLMLSTFSAVIYAYLNQKPELVPHADYDWVIYGVVKANLLLPLLSSVIQGINAAISPGLKFIALKNASIRVESELYAFRCKVGKYNTLKTGDDDDEEEKKKKKKKKKKDKKDGAAKGEEGKEAEAEAPPPNPRKAFQHALNSIWQDLSNSDLQSGALLTPPFASATSALDEINSRIRSNRAEQNIYLVPMARRAVGGNDAQKAAEDRANVEKEVNRLKGMKNMFKKRKDTGTKQSWFDWGGFKKIADFLSDPNIVHEDGLGNLSADDYIKVRVIPMVAYFTKEAPGMSFSKTFSAGIAVVLSVMSSALAAFGQVVFVPAILAVAASVAAWSDYDQTELRLLQTNSAKSQLHQLLLWWESLTVIEKRVIANKALLVKKTEAAIQSQATVFQGGSSDKDADEETTAS